MGMGMGMGMGMRQDIEELAREAEWQIREHKWVPSANDHTVAARVAADLCAAVGTPQSQQELLAVTRLGHLREALAAVTIALAYVHGPMAWFLGAAATALTPILHWRAMPARHGHTFGAAPPPLQQYTEAETAIRRLQDTLARLATA
ncbi:hypothetical protein YW5DRAFT_02777 [Streptomyces sp. Ncost-T6T-1]|uniref:hypothetical protein n=1 Tax=Streptomyces sp. Ncost-T6T-1 TaxID=1100828 RepID=UPI0008047B07|nr:hypothetical protein [Streptomyces sp. Ncost-T6T-1]SBV05156.1 hypothetical protein YW5DRAFT_02777 [Streptomyces sp. Ncost-T6T-1]